MNQKVTGLFVTLFLSSAVAVCALVASFAGSKLFGRLFWIEIVGVTCAALISAILGGALSRNLSRAQAYLAHFPIYLVAMLFMWGAIESGQMKALLGAVLYVLIGTLGGEIFYRVSKQRGQVAKGGGLNA